MNNPWLGISYSDYENHMTEIGQAQVLNKLTKLYLNKYKPESFALIGCSTGNGLEHIKNTITKNVYAIDINPEYLEVLKEKFNKKIKNLTTYNLDIRKDDLKYGNIDLCFVGLVLEYVEPKTTLKKIIKTLNKNGVLIIVIQKNKEVSFVTKTKYKSLEKLADISNEVNEREIDRFIHSENMKLINRKYIKLTENKSFISMEYRMMKKK